MLSQCLFDSVRYILDLLASQLGIHRQRDYLSSNLLGDRQRYFAVALFQVSRLPMDGQRIMYAGVNALRFQVRQHRVAPGYANDIEVVDVTNIGRLVRRDHIGTGTMGLVCVSMAAPRLGQFFQAGQLGSENCCLKRINPFTVAEQFVLIFRLAAVVAEPAYLSEQRFIVTGHCTRIAISAEILPGIKAETGDVANAAATLSFVLSQMSLRGVFDQPKVMTGGQLAQRFQFSGLTIQMHRHQDFRARRDGGFDLAGVEVVSARVNIDKNRLGPGANDGFDGGDEGVRRGDYFVTRFQAQGQRSQRQCRRAGSDADGALCADSRGKCLFEISRFRAENETRIVDDPFDGRVDFGFVSSVLGFEIDQRYSDGSLSLSGNSFGAIDS